MAAKVGTKAFATLILSFMPVGVFAASSIQTFPYECERGAMVWATYISGDEGSLAVIHVEGQQVALGQVISGSGAKYAQSADGVGYVWWTKGDEALLMWEDVPNSTDETLLSQCKTN